MINNIIPHDRALKFMLGGNAHFCLWNQKTDHHERYQIRMVGTSSKQINNLSAISANTDPIRIWQVNAVLPNARFRKLEQVAVLYSVKNRDESIGYKYYELVKQETPASKGIMWYLNQLFNGKALQIPEHFVIYHFGKCSVCSHTLTTPQSIIDGIGPICLKALME